MTPAKKLASHRFGGSRGVKPLLKRGFKAYPPHKALVEGGDVPLYSPVIPPKGGTQSNFKWLRFPGFRVSAPE